ncbi:hypothetical protein HanIR_Chr02g0064951 [Helianthus annuus]|nr:hypothetical protein HanIR_Chr02g0064951 [Helianthus annuus]
MLANVKTINEKYWYKFPRFLQLILETKYTKLPVTVKTYDVKMMNHMVFSMLNQKSRDNVEIKYQNKKELEKFGAFAEIHEEVPAQINATIADEHDVQIVEAPAGTNEPVENEVNEDVDENETETEIHAESLTAKTENVDEPVNVSPPHVEPVTTTAAADAENIQEDLTVDLPTRKRSKIDPRISGEDSAEVQTTIETTTPVDATQPKFNYIPSELNPKIIEFMANERAAMYMPVLKPGEGSSSGPSDAEVLRAAELLQTAAREIEAASKLKQDETCEITDSSDSDDLF